MVGSKEECELVATSLGLGDTTPTTIERPKGLPPGCIITYTSRWLGWNPKAEGAPCDVANYDCLCIKGKQFNFIICIINNRKI